MATLYDTDFFEWTQDTAAKVRDRRFDDIDLSALAEEIEDLGKRDRKSVFSAMVQLLAHLLKWEYQQEYSDRAGDTSWKVSIVKQRQAIRREFEDSPSLRRYAREDMPEAYKDAVVLAETETGMKGAFPTECLYSFEQILDLEFYPCDQGCG